MNPTEPPLVLGQRLPRLAVHASIDLLTHKLLAPAGTARVEDFYWPVELSTLRQRSVSVRLPSRLLRFNRPVGRITVSRLRAREHCLGEKLMNPSDHGHRSLPDSLLT